MAVLTIPSRRASAVLVPHLLRLAGRLAGLVRPVTPVLRNVASIPFTVAGLGCIDCGVFYAGHVAGFIVTGLSLMWLEHLIATEDE